MKKAFLLGEREREREREKERKREREGKKKKKRIPYFTEGFFFFFEDGIFCSGSISSVCISTHTGVDNEINLKSAARSQFCGRNFKTTRLTCLWANHTPIVLCRRCVYWYSRTVVRSRCTRHVGLKCDHTHWSNFQTRAVVFAVGD